MKLVHRKQEKKAVDVICEGLLTRNLCPACKDCTYNENPDDFPMRNSDCGYYKEMHIHKFYVGEGE